MIYNLHLLKYPLINQDKIKRLRCLLLYAKSTIGEFGNSFPFGNTAPKGTSFVYIPYSGLNFADEGICIQMFQAHGIYEIIFIY